MDNEGGRRVLPHKAHYSSKNTIEICKKLCFEKGYQYAGVEYSKECFCGNNVPKKVASQQTECNMNCSGDRSQKCGGPNRMNVYLSAGIIHTGCPAKLFPLGYLLFCRLLLMQISKVGTFF